MSRVRHAGESLRRRIPGLLDERLLPGMAIGICDAESVLWSAGFGTTRAGGDDPVTAETMFSVQSCSKMYTATAVLLAVQQGLVDLDAPIIRYLPEFEVNSCFEDHPARLITLRHLLSHTAGFTHEAPIGSNYLVGRASFPAHCRSIGDTWLRFPVGHHYEYSNLGIDLAGYVLQRCSGLAFHEFVRQSLFAPLGLERTTFDPRVIMGNPGRAIGHTRGTARLPVRIPMVAAGGLYSSVEDACRYLQLHLTDGAGLIDSALLAETYKVPGAPGRDRGYGLGTMLSHYGDIVIRGHRGGGFGFLSDLYWAPEEKVGVVVLTNSTSHTLQWQLASDIFGDIIPVRQRRRPHRSAPQQAAVTVGRKTLQGMAGDYTGSGNDQVSFAIDHDRSVLVRGGTRHVVDFIGPRDFRIADSPQERYRFRDFDDAGHPAYLEFLADGSVRYRNEVPDPDPAEADGPWNRDYAVRASGGGNGGARLRKENGIPLFEHWDGGTLRLREHRPGLYLSATGEMLDLTRTPPTYANVRLHRV